MYNSKSLTIRAINWAHIVKEIYLAKIYMAVIIVLFATYVPLGKIITTFFATDIYQRFYEEIITSLAFVDVFPTIQVVAMFSVVTYVAYINAPQWKRSVYLIDFVVSEPPKNWELSLEEALDMYKKQPNKPEESVNFMTKVMNSGGLGDHTKLPKAMHEAKDGGRYQPTMALSREEAEIIIFPMVEELLKRTNFRPKDIDFLIVNCSLFVPTPSLAAMVAHKFQFREDVCSYNLGGMGCSAGVISIDLAKRLLSTSSNSTALVISTENISNNMYEGDERSMLLQNALFRAGGAAILLSNRNYNKGRYARYKLMHSGRTLMTDTESYECVFEQQDAKGNRGVRLSRNIVNVAGKAMQKQFTSLAPHILPMTEQLKCLVTMILDRACRYLHPQFPDYIPKRYQVYTPDFKLCIDHFCIHAGGRAVIEGVQKNLNLSELQAKPSFETLKNWGNTSSSSVWYELDYIERSKECNLRAGHQILQIAFGSGFKCNSAVWLRLQ